ncbi:class F sortase [Streptomyces sp. NPDC049813]|uniref:class F sortase n=1 Tax=Streptomyces sp. NPDC049813 TaxID=3365597 RepID=UPI0037B2506B
MTSPESPRHGKGRDLIWIVTAVVCVLLALSSAVDRLAGHDAAHGPGGGAGGQTGQARPVAPRAPSAPSAPFASRTTARGSAVPPPALPHAADPVRLRIAALDLDAAVGPLSLDSEGRLPAPAGHTDVGWWREGPSPGEAGPAVITGHLDTVTGPAVFAGLAGLRPGDRVEITRADASTAVFEVRATAEYPQGDFPTDTVYGPTPDAQLRLITCAGAYDRGAGRYLANTVVSATMVTP